MVIRKKINGENKIIINIESERQYRRGAMAKMRRKSAIWRRRK
jgi:hypothetical protein